MAFYSQNTLRPNPLSKCRVPVSLLPHSHFMHHSMMVFDQKCPLSSHPPDQCWVIASLLSHAHSVRPRIMVSGRYYPSPYLSTLYWYTYQLWSHSHDWQPTIVRNFQTFQNYVERGIDLENCRAVRWFETMSWYLYQPSGIPRVGESTL